MSIYGKFHIIIIASGPCDMCKGARTACGAYGTCPDRTFQPLVLDGLDINLSGISMYIVVLY